MVLSSRDGLALPPRFGRLHRVGMRIHDSMTAAAFPYGVGVAALGATTFAYHDVVHGLEPIPASFGAERLALAYALARVHAPAVALAPAVLADAR